MKARLVFTKLFDAQLGELDKTGLDQVRRALHNLALGQPLEPLLPRGGDWLILPCHGYQILFRELTREEAVAYAGVDGPAYYIYSIAWPS